MRARNLWRPHGRWINGGSVRVNAEVTRVAAGDRDIALPWHGRVVIVWSGRRAQDVALFDHSGTCLGRTLLPPSL